MTHSRTVPVLVRQDTSNEDRACYSDEICACDTNTAWDYLKYEALRFGQCISVTAVSVQLDGF